MSRLTEPSTFPDAEPCVHCQPPTPSGGWPTPEEQEAAFPDAWQPLSAHPELTPGRWAESEQLSGSGIAYCPHCGTLWIRFFDPKDLIYTDFIPLHPSARSFLTVDGELERVWPWLDHPSRLVKSRIQGWFAGARYDFGEAADRLIEELGVPDIDRRTAERRLVYLRGMLTLGNPWLQRERQARGGAPPFRPRTLEPLLTLVERLRARGEGPSLQRLKEDLHEVAAAMPDPAPPEAESPRDRATVAELRAALDPEVRAAEAASVFRELAGEVRQVLARSGGGTGRHDPPEAEPRPEPDPPPGLDRRGWEALREMTAIRDATLRRFTPDHVEAMVDVLDALIGLESARPSVRSPGDPVKRLIRGLHDLLRTLHLNWEAMGVDTDRDHLVRMLEAARPALERLAASR